MHINSLRTAQHALHCVMLLTRIKEFQYITCLFLFCTFEYIMILKILRLHFFSEYLKVHNYAYLHQCTFQEIIPQLREIYAPPTLTILPWRSQNFWCGSLHDVLHINDVTHKHLMPLVSFWASFHSWTVLGSRRSERLQKTAIVP